MTEVIIECDCGAEIRTPYDGERHSPRCSECGLIAFIDEDGDIEKFVVEATT